MRIYFIFVNAYLCCFINCYFWGSTINVLFLFMNGIHCIFLSFNDVSRLFQWGGQGGQGGGKGGRGGARGGGQGGGKLYHPLVYRANK